MPAGSIAKTVIVQMSASIRGMAVFPVLKVSVSKVPGWA